MAIPTASHMACAFGILGNTVSFLVYLAPLPTFYGIYMKKSTEGFQSIPYAVALFSAKLLLYYGFLKTNGLMIMTINTIGCAIEATYLILFMLYATEEAKIYTTKLLIFFDVGVYGLIILCASLFSHGKMRVTIVGWICAVFSVCVFAAPLSIMTPNILGFAFGIAQMVLYIIYKDNRNQVLPEGKLQDLATTVINLSTIMEMQENFKQEEHAVNEEANNRPVEASKSNV